jgi:hypothetical protein
MVLTRPLGIVMTTVILAVVYFLVLTPLALLRRLGNRDPLDLRWDPRPRESAWKPKALPPPDSDRWYRPF